MKAKRTAKTMGRPPLDPALRRTEQLNVRATKAERKMLEAEAARQGITISDLLMQAWRKAERR